MSQGRERGRPSPYASISTQVELVEARCSCGWLIGRTMAGAPVQRDACPSCGRRIMVTAGRRPRVGPLAGGVPAERDNGT